MVIDQNNDSVTKPKLTIIIVKALSKYNDWSRVAAKQTNKETNKQIDRKLMEQKRYGELSKKLKMRRPVFCCYLNK